MSDKSICTKCGVIATNPELVTGCPETEDMYHDWREHLDYGRGQKSPMSNEERRAILESTQITRGQRSGPLLNSNMSIVQMQARIHQQNRDMGWWDNPREMGTLLCLVHSEISEAMEGERKGLMDDHLPHRSMLEVELADAMIRIMDIAASRNLDLAGAIVEKVDYNRKRADHQPGARAEAHGKKF
jgi:NTP pyrophosphatase (non-canonical NTP hydrolase)